MLLALRLDDVISPGRLRSLTIAARRRSWSVRKTGRSPGSLEPEETAGLDYRVVDGIAVEDFWPGARAFAQGPLLEVLVDRTGLELELSPDKASAINFNTLLPGGRYERHVDGWGMTLVVFCTACEGGELCVDQGGQDVRVTPEVGKAVLIDGGRMAHEVLPVVSGVRVTLLFSYLMEGRDETRLAGLKEALYEGN